MLLFCQAITMGFPSRSTALLLLALAAPGAIAFYHHREFGRSGDRGRSGENGASGAGGETVMIFARGESQFYDLSGKPGENGMPGESGGDARSCRQPQQPNYDLVGAPGGDGGHGGQGGGGGAGGGVTIFYDNPEHLRAIAVKNLGGAGGRGGPGGPGGEGCGCDNPQWWVSYCRWQLEQRAIAPQEGETPQWQVVDHQTQICSGVQRVDERENVPSLPRAYRGQSTHHYRWVYQGIVDQDFFSCEDGKRGRDGQDGQDGPDGEPGRVTLVPQWQIPQETHRRRSPIQGNLGQTFQLVRNLWVEKEGLRSRLHPASQVGDRYRFLAETRRQNYEIRWGATATPETLGIDQVAIEAYLDSQHQVAFTVPGTLETTQTRQQDTTILTITNGFHPDRIGAFTLGAITPIPNQLPAMVLEDSGATRPLLKRLTLELSCATRQSASGITVTPDYRERNRRQITLPPTAIPPYSDLTVDRHQYRIELGRHCAPWLKPGYDVEYRATIHQHTHSGQEYTQQLSKRFTMP